MNFSNNTKNNEFSKKIMPSSSGNTNQFNSTSLNTKSSYPISFFNTNPSPNLQNEKLLKCLRELYELLRDANTGMNKDKFYANVIITGHEGSGKSSFIEYLTSIDLFPKSYFNKKKAPIKIKIVRENYKEALKISKDGLGNTLQNTSNDISIRSDSSRNNVSGLSVYKRNKEGTNHSHGHNVNKTANYDFKFILNNGLAFTEALSFINYLNEADLSLILDTDGFLNLKIEIHLLKFLSESEELKDTFFFNFNIYEIDIEDLITNKFKIPTENSFYLICNSCDKKDKLERSLNILKNNINLTREEIKENILVVFTKPDKLDNIRDVHDLLESSDSNSNSGNTDEMKDFKFCFIKLRSYEERSTYPKISDFYRHEDNFYSERIFSKNEFIFKNCGMSNIIEFVINNFINLFKKNLKENSQNVLSHLANEISDLEELGREIPTANDKKLKFLRNQIKSILKHINKLNDNYANILNKFIKVNIYSLDIEDDKNYKNYFITRELNVCVNSDLDKYTNSKEISQMIKSKLDKKNTALTKKELESILFSISRKIVENELQIINDLFEKNIDINLESLSNKIYIVFKNVKESFKEKIFDVFQSYISSAKEELKKLLFKVTEIELNSNYLNDKQFYQQFNNFYNNNLLKTNFAFNNEYEKFAKECVYNISKDKVNSLIGIYCKFYSYHLYTKLKEKFSDISLEDIIKEVMNEDLDLYIEEEKNRAEREISKKNANLLIKIIDLIIKSEAINENSNISQSRISLNSSFMKLSSSIISISEIKNLKSKFENLISSELMTIRIDANDEINFEEFEGNINIDLNELHHLHGDLINKLEIDVEGGLDERGKNGELNETIYLDENMIRDKTEEKEEKEEKEENLVSPIKKTPRGTKLSLPLKFNPILRSSLFTGLVMIWDSTNEISVYNYLTNKITQHSVPDIPYGYFLEDNRYININDTIYIAGGVKGNKEKQRLFIKLERPKNDVVLLANIPEAVVRHSMIHVPVSDSIVLIGGKDTRMTYIYNIERAKWEPFGQLNTERLDTTILLLNQNIVLCFGGIKEKKNRNETCLVEYKQVDANNFNNEWNFLSVKSNTSDILPKVSGICGFGVIANYDKLILVGGYDVETFDDEENAFQIILNNDNEDETFVSIEAIKISKAKDIQSWFQENNFITFLDEKGNNLKKEFVNFNVDGEIVKYCLDCMDMEFIPCNYNKN